MASSSSSSHQRNQALNAFSGIGPAGKRRLVSESSTLYDVFINHRGPDVKNTLATQLYNSLEQLGIRAFLDSEEKELGNSFPSTIETAIRSAKVHIAIFSKRYAESPWCLDELVLMLESTAKIIPVFYQVKPSDLRQIEKGAYAQAFFEHKLKGRYHEKQLSAWIEALQSLSLIAGEEFNSEGDCQKIVAAAQKEVERNTCLHVAEYPVGLENLVKDFQKRCLDKLVQDFENQFGQEEGKHKAQVVAIFGMGGAGKTTLAKELFNRKKLNYSRSSFLFDVREASVRSQLPFLQLTLLKDLFNYRHPGFTSTEEGTSRLKDCLQRTPTLSSLIVVDDIDHVEQLNALAVMDISNKSGNNLVIVTTRDVGVLITAGIMGGYNLKGMNSTDATELFCWHAFRQDRPCCGYEVLVKDFVDVCGGLPLSLQVLGRHVHGRAHSYWSSELIKAKKMLPRDVKQRLRISFDALDDDEKQVFMDVACFFLGKPKRMAEKVCEGSGWNAQYALDTLKDRCLVEENKKFSIMKNQTEIVLNMHDHLRDLGREMALEFRSPPRLWCPGNLKSLESKGLKSIFAETNARCFHSIFDESMNYRVTFFLGHSDFRFETSASVLWLQLDGNSTELPSIPSWIPLQKLQGLEIKHGRLKTLWENRIQAPSHLEELLIFQTSLKQIPELLGIADSLENVFLDAKDWPIQGLSLLQSLSMNLSSICLSFSRLEGEQASVKRESTFCKPLVIMNFKFNGEVDWNNGGISTSVKAPVSGLEKLEICYEEFLSKILICGIHYPKLKSIKLEAIENLMEVNLTSVKTLNCLAITRCSKVKRIILDRLGKLEYLQLKGCEELVELGIRGCPEFREVPAFSLVIATCKKIERIIIDTRVKLKYLKLNGCQSLRSVPGNFHITNLDIYDCPKLEELTMLCKVSCMENIEVDNCEKLQSIILPTTLFSLSVQNCRNLERVSGTSDLMELKNLTICKCLKLKELTILCKVSCMDNMEVDNCEKLQSITLPATLFSLSVQNCRNLERVSGTSDLMELKNLTICKCPNLKELTILCKVSCMDNIEVDNCEKLQSITLPTALFSLSVQNCRNLERVSGTSDLMELKNLTICKCLNLKELTILCKVSCMDNIEVDNCEKLQSITLPTTLLSLSVQNCRDLKRVSGIDDLMELKKLTICKCPKLKELTILCKVSCMDNIEVDNCEKLQSITLPTTLLSLSVQNCRNLERVSGTDDLMELKKLTICKCPKLEKLPSLFIVSCMENIEIDICLQRIMLPTTLISLSVKNGRCLERVSGIGDFMQLTELNISQCPMLEELPSLAIESCRKKIRLKNFEEMHLQCVTLPRIPFSLSLQNCRNLQTVSGTSLSVQNCRNLQRLSGIGDIMELTELNIRNCPNLDELPTLSRVSCMKNIEVDTCEKLQNITLPTTLSHLSLQNCRDLQRLSGTGDFMQLTELNISKCPMLVELPNLARLSLLKNIMIDSCEKLENVAGIEELQALQFVLLKYCSNALIRNCIHKLKRLPLRGMDIIGRAVDGAESILNESLFSEAHIGADSH